MSEPSRDESLHPGSSTSGQYETKSSELVKTTTTTAISTHSDCNIDVAEENVVNNPLKTTTETKTSVTKEDGISQPIEKAAGGEFSNVAQLDTPTVPKNEQNTKQVQSIAQIDAVVAATGKPRDDHVSSLPRDRDVILGEGSAGHKTNILLQDVMRLHRTIWKLQGKVSPTTPDEAYGIAEELFRLMKRGKEHELAGIKDVPYPFMKSTGRFMEKDGDSWKELSDSRAKQALAEAMVQEFMLDDLGDLEASPYKELKETLQRVREDSESDVVVPQAKDAILLASSEDVAGDKMYEQQGGNRTIFHLASQLVSSYTNTAEKRVESALFILKGLDEIELYTEDGKEKIPPPNPSRKSRFLLRSVQPDGSIAWKVIDGAAAAEFVVIFVFEVFLEKELHLISSASLGDVGVGMASVATADVTKASTVAIDDPTDYDVLFGRGGMTNSHPGNRRFRDVIALHRPDYVRAIKMDKPNVARKIVRAIRQGHPPGRFLKKCDDGKWYDVGDRAAAEKTSQGLRERTNAEKRQRSALREALRIRKQDVAETDDNDSSSGSKPKKQKSDNAAAPLPMPTLNYVGSGLGASLPPNTKEALSSKKTDGSTSEVVETLNTAGLPPNAVDEEGNILVTDYDILCGRGGLTNHHKGNKRFRDIVALHRPDYVRAPKIQKPSVARVIVRAIRNGDPPGRFLKKDEKSGKWYDVGDKKAAEKTSQALREKTNEERGHQQKKDPSMVGVHVLLPNPASYLAAVVGAPILLPSVQTPKVETGGPVKTTNAAPREKSEELSAEQKAAAIENVSDPNTTSSIVQSAQDVTKGNTKDDVSTEEPVKSSLPGSIDCQEGGVGTITV